MQKRTEAEVIINGKRYKIAGIEEEEYLQKIATYLNSKYAAMKEVKGYRTMDLDMKQALVLINVADDYLKCRQQLADKQTEVEQRETDIFNMKHDMLADRSQIKELEGRIEQLKDARMEDQKKTTMNPVYTQEAYCRDEGDIGNTYVEISLTNQTMWFYKNGSLIVETPVVTGNPYAGHETPSGGVWSLKGRMRNQTLVGQGYASPVDYWMPFNGGVGIHDMQSRAWFGGTIYLGSGSHGCVNTPLAAVKLIYDQIEEGVPVIVYKDESEEALAQVTGPTDVWTLNSMIEDLYGTVDDDGIGSIVSWSRSAAAQAAQAAAAQTTSSGTPAT